MDEVAGNLLGQEKKTTLLDDQVFWVRVEKTKNLMEPVVKWILKLEGDGDTIHFSCKALQEIEESIEKNLPLSLLKKSDEKTFMDKFLERKAYALKSIHKAACLLDPKARGCYLSPEEQLDAIEHIVNFSQSCHFSDTIDTIDKEQLLVEIAQYRANEGIWAKDFIWASALSENMRPSIWWKGIIGQSSRLSNVAVKILSVPATSASTERSFSTFSNIHTKKRNKLTTSRAIKLTYIAHYWRTKSKTPTVKSNTNAKDQSISVIDITEDDDPSEQELEAEPIAGPSCRSVPARSKFLEVAFEHETDSDPDASSTTEDDVDVPYQDEDNDEQSSSSEI